MKRFIIMLIQISATIAVATQHISAGEWHYVKPIFNAKKGDIMLVKDPKGAITPIINTLGQYWDHTMMVVENNQMRHNTMKTENIGQVTENYKVKVSILGITDYSTTVTIPTQLDAQTLQNGNPGIITQSIRSPSSFAAILTISDESKRSLLDPAVEMLNKLDGYYKLNSYVDFYRYIPTTGSRDNESGSQCSGTVAWVYSMIGKQMFVPSLYNSEVLSQAADIMYNNLTETFKEIINDQIDGTGHGVAQPIVMGLDGAFGITDKVKKKVKKRLFETNKVHERMANQVINTFLFNDGNNITDSWRKGVTTLNGTSISPDNLLMVGMANPENRFTGMQSSKSSYYDTIGDYCYDSIEKYSASGGYYYYIENGTKEPPQDPRLNRLYKTPCDIPPEINGGITVECCIQ